MSTQQWVIFRVEAGQYALPLERVVEVLRMVAMRPVPDGPAWLAGVINLRGRVLPIMDLRARLGLPRQPTRLETRIIVAELGHELIGLLADEVLEVLTQPSSAIDLPTALPSTPGRPLAAVQAGDRLVTVFDLERLSADAGSLPLLEAG
jgi:purine-binding chemotaxis protein CheW